MRRHRQDAKEEIRDRLPLADLIAEATGEAGQPAGGHSLKWRCPFHKEKTPSLHADETTGQWHCFGCNAGGDLFAFIMRWQALDFPEAVKWGAGRLGLRLDPAEDLREEAPAVGLDIVAKLAEELGKRPEVEAYLTGRGLTPETLRALRVGYCPADGLPGVDPPAMEAAGLRSKGRDTFAGYMTFPHLFHGAAEYISGRWPGDPPEKKPKSMKPAGRPMRHLFMEETARRNHDPRLLVVEGQLCAMSLYQAGHAAVATCGATGVKGEVLRDRLRAFMDAGRRVFIAFDNDKPGNKAALELARTLGPEAYMVALPEGRDFNDLLQADPAGFSVAVEALLQAARPWYEVEAEHAKGDPRAVADLLQTVAAWPAPRVVADAMLKRIADLTGVAPAALLSDYKAFMREAAKEQGAEADAAPFSIVSKILVGEELRYQVSFVPPGGGAPIRRIVPRADLLHSQSIVRELAPYGFPVSSPTAGQRIKQAEELEGRPEIPLENGHERPGAWLGEYSAFALHEAVVEANGYRSRYIGDPEALEPLRSRGKADDMAALLREYLPRHPLIPFLCGLSLASPLLRRWGSRLLLFHLYGETRNAKTAAVKLALALWGDPSAFMYEHGTQKAMYEWAARYPHLPKAYDDIGKIFAGKKPQDRQRATDDFIFTMTSGQGAQRLTQRGHLQKAGAWQCSIFSTMEGALVSGAGVGGPGSRVIQYHARKPILPEEDGKALHVRLSTLYGHIGAEFMAVYRFDARHLELAERLAKRLTGTAGRAAPWLAAALYAAEWLVERVGVKVDALESIVAVAGRANEDEMAPYHVRGLEYLRGWVLQNRGHFYTGEGEHDKRIGGAVECFGAIVPGFVYIHPNAFKEAVAKNEMEHTRLIKELATAGYAELGEGNLTVPCRVGGRLARVFKLKVDFEAPELEGSAHE